MFRNIPFRCFMIAGTAVALAACQSETVDETSVNVEDTTANLAEGNASATNASIPLNGPNGEAMGSVSLADEGGALVMNLSATGLPAGVHGIHLHTTGLCEGPKFESAGSHWNPSNKKHGKENPEGAHAGDLDNLTVAADGSGTGRISVSGATLAAGAMSIADADGTALVIHAKADDYKTDPSGDSGDRIACAVLAPSSGTTPA